MAMMMMMDMTPRPLSKHKRDPAWKHCQMFQSDGSRVQLKCNYCDKLFKGGGIHRMKEHLAGHRTNAATCPNTPSEVRLLMQQSLDVDNGRKKRKTTHVDDHDHHLVDNEVFMYDDCNVNNTIEAMQIVQVPGSPGDTSFMLDHQEDIPTQRSVVKRKRGRPPKESVTPVPKMQACRNFAEKDVKVNNQVHQAIGRFLYDVGFLPLYAVNSVHFQRMVDAIAAQGPGVMAPTYNDLRGWILKNSFDEVRTDNDIYISTWERTGRSVQVDQWETTKGRIFINFLVSCSERIIFLKTVDVTDITNSVDALTELLKDVVSGVGAGNVVQLITNGDSQLVAAGKLLTEDYPTLLSNTCASGSIHMILEDFGKLEWIQSVLEQAKSLTKYVYNHSDVLNMVRRYSFGNDLVVPGISCGETNFATLKRLVDLRCNLESFVNSPEWIMSAHSKELGGQVMFDVIGSQAFWSACTLITQLVDPLLRLLRIVSNEKRSPMAYIYGGMYRVRETIKKLFIKMEDQLIYWSSIDLWWQNHWTNPLHAAGFYLNPKFFYSMEGDLPNNVVSQMLDCVEKLVPDPTIQDKIIKELACYKNAAGDFSRPMAIRARDTLLPVEWWSTYGGACPNLSRLAIRILSQSCSIAETRKSQIHFEQLSNTKNCIEHRRLSDLLYVQLNLQLLQNAGQNNYGVTDPISMDNQTVVQEWISQADQSIEDYARADWTAVQPVSVITNHLTPSTDDIEYLGKDFKDYEIFSQMDHVREKVQDSQNDIQIG